MEMKKDTGNGTIDGILTVFQSQEATIACAYDGRGECTFRLKTNISPSGAQRKWRKFAWRRTCERTASPCDQAVILIKNASERFQGTRHGAELWDAPETLGAPQPLVKRPHGSDSREIPL